MAEEPLETAIALLQQMIRNRCVNDGTPDSGQEARTVALLENLFAGSSLATRTFEPHPGRRSLLVRHGHRPDRPTLLLVGHTDVVPANPDRWSVDPFAGELIDGEVWGRGAVDMLSMTATMAVAMRSLADHDVDLPVDVAFLAVADEEAGGRFGSRWLVENHPEAVAADWVITEAGGFPFRRGDRTKLELFHAEKGAARIVVEVKGRAGHAAYSNGSQNALTRAGAVLVALGDLAATPHVSDTWRQYASAMFEDDLAARLTDVDHLPTACWDAPHELTEHAYASTHQILTPTMVRGSFKGNVIPDHVEIVLDVRTLPGQDALGALAAIDEALHAHRDYASSRITSESAPTSTTIDDRFHTAAQLAAREVYPDADLVPAVMTAASDARFFRAAGSAAYGFSLYSDAIAPADYFAMIHGVDERVDTASIGHQLHLWPSIARHLGGPERG